MGLSHSLMCPEYAGLAWKFHVSPDSCDNPEHYENYLRLCAIEEHNVGMGVTHILLSDDEKRITGFVSLRATSLVTTDCHDIKIVNPALEISELAVDMDFERRGIGSTLVNIAILLADQLKDKFIGIKHIVLCADPKAIGFYEKLNFGKLEDLYEVLHDGWNNNCIPMYVAFPTKQENIV